MPDLSVAEYDEAEQSAISVTPNRVVAAFQPVTYARIGYPDRVRQESELFKYIDVMHEGEFEQHVTRDLAGLSEDEFDLVRKITSLICGFSESRFGIKSTGRASVLGALNVFRHIRYQFGDARPCVLEIGPGNGYLGAMLMLEGYPYLATEVSQAFYLYQNHLWNFISGGNVIELAHPDNSVDNIGVPPPGGAIHIPWWELVRLKPELIPPIDVATGNRVLCEMHPQSLDFILKIASGSMRSRGDRKAFVFEDWGLPGANSADAVTENFYKTGFGLVYYDPLITVMAPRDMECGMDFLSLPNKRKKKLLLIHIRNLVRRLTGLPPLPENTVYGPYHYTSADNPLAKSIVSGRQTGQDTRTVGIDQLNEFYTEVLGTADHLTPDERFQMWPNP